MFRKLIGACAGLAMMGMAGAADAAMFKFNFTSTINSSPSIPGVSLGDTLTLEVIADNGGTSLISQNWGTTDVSSAALSVGTYSATYLTTFTLANFTTDLTGTLTVSSFNDSSGSNQDIFGTGPSVVLTSAIVQDFNFGSAFFGPNVSDFNAWTVTAVPLPAALPLMGTGLAVLGFLGWRRRKAA